MFKRASRKGYAQSNGRRARKYPIPIPGATLGILVVVRVLMRGDGNLVLRSATGTALWPTGTAGNQSFPLFSPHPPATGTGACDPEARTVRRLQCRKHIEGCGDPRCSAAPRC
jgi:hypothetical protein